MRRLHGLVTAAILAATGSTAALAQGALRTGLAAPAVTESPATGARAPAWKLLAGYQFTQTFGLEAAYGDLGRYGYLSGVPGLSAAGDVRMRAWSLAGTGSLALGSRWALIGKLGVGANIADPARAAGMVGALPWGPVGAPRSDLYLGLGLGYAVGRGFGLRFEYENFGRGALAADAATRNDHWAVNLRYSF